MSMHLIKFGFTPSYRIWTYHGEKAKKRARKEVRQIQPRGEYDTGFDRCLENLANGNVPESSHVEVETPQDAETSEDPEENTKEYYEALFASQKPLHENTEVTQLDAIARLMALKCHRNLCRDGYFEVDRNGDGQKRQTIAKNILRYLPVLPRIQRLFMTEDTAQQMRWAVEGNRYTDKMIHPSDGTAWKNFVKKFPLKAGDPRSVAVAISTDGFNPYGPKYPGKNMNVYLEPLVDDLIEASIAEAVLNVEVANFTTKHYDPNIPTKHNPVLRYNAANNEEVPKLSIFVGLGGKSSGSKPYRTDLHERTLIHSKFKAIHWKNTHRDARWIAYPGQHPPLSSQNEELRTGAKPNVFAVLKKMKQRKTPILRRGGDGSEAAAQSKGRTWSSRFWSTTAETDDAADATEQQMMQAQQAR
ncbi:hypothetical protein QYE76_053695 [Lolium multiflorum]|uniref:Uncharacterized protein n=1 Tax=Lolium multiflorum TaxID=4521 RepID=A0AAD8SWA1_LOLMU|nr:hypothetical protein QYE76_053695 [Lolium multiflorum]